MTPTAVPSDAMRIDFHMHTWASHDCLSDPEAVLAQARRAGMQRIALTDHNELWVALEMAAKYPDEIIPGEEVKTAEGIDVIGLYLHECIPKGTPAVETAERVRAQGGLVYLPHPFARGKGGDGRFVEMMVPHLDIIEVHNGRLRPDRLNTRALEVGRSHGLLQAAGSDAHTLREVGRSCVQLPRHSNDPAALRAALARGKIHGTTSHPAVHLASTWAKVHKRLWNRRGSQG